METRSPPSAGVSRKPQRLLIVSKCLISHFQSNPVSQCRIRGRAPHTWPCSDQHRPCLGFSPWSSFHSASSVLVKTPRLPASATTGPGTVVLTEGWAARYLKALALGCLPRMGSPWVCRLDLNPRATGDRTSQEMVVSGSFSGTVL